MNPLILLKNAAVLDANHNLDVMDILVDNGMIAAAEPGIAESAAGTVVNLAGYTLMPGLFNNHIHYADPQGNPEKSFVKEFLGDWAMHGVLGVRDMGLDHTTYEAYNAWKAEVSGPNAPDLYSYGYFQHLCQLRMPKGMPAPPPPPPGQEMPKPKPFKLLGSVEAAEAAAKASMDAGCQGVKIHGFAREPELMAQVRAMVKVAGSRGGFVSAHVNTSDEVMILVECGAHEAAHIPHDLTPLADVEKMAAINFYCCPTVSAYFRMHRDGMLTDGMYQDVLSNIENYHKLGVKLTVGTDFMSIVDPPYEDSKVPVFEMATMAQCGMSVQEVITAATLNSAYLCGASNAVGEIRRGRRANLIAVKAPVDETFEALNNVDFVMNKGVIIKPL